MSQHTFQGVMISIRPKTDNISSKTIDKKPLNHHINKKNNNNNKRPAFKAAGKYTEPLGLPPINNNNKTRIYHKRKRPETITTKHKIYIKELQAKIQEKKKKEQELELELLKKKEEKKEKKIMNTLDKELAIKYKQIKQKYNEKIDNDDNSHLINIPLKKDIILPSITTNKEPKEPKKEPKKEEEECNESFYSSTKIKTKKRYAKMGIN